MKIIVNSHEFILLPEKALFWPKEKMLVVADIHLGKAATFRSYGIPIPEGCMHDDLYRLQELIRNYNIKTCIVVGDLIHAKQGLTNYTTELFLQFLKETKAEIHLVIGNHDRTLKKKLPEGWNLIIHEDKYVHSSFVFKHHPEIDCEGFVWSGHMHPCASLRYAGKVLKLPCFVINNHVGILPAFTAFTDGLSIKKTKNIALYPIADNKVYQLL